MENLGPLGTGNSRFMKSNIPASTTLSQLIQMLNNGTFPYDIGPLNSAGISQQGTPLNKGTLFSDQTMAKYPSGIEDPDGAFEKLSEAALARFANAPMYQEITVDLSTAQEGDIVKLPENGKLVDFYAAKLNYESGLNGAGRTLVIRKDTYDDRVWDSGDVNAYASSDLDSWFNNTYKNMLGADIQSVIGTTKFYYTPGNGNNTVGTLERAIFALSLTELGRSHTYANIEGSALPTASTLQVAYRNGSTTTQWTRSPYTSYTDDAWILGPGGEAGRTGCDGGNGSRPAFTLPSTFTATCYVDDDGNLHDEQEYYVSGSITDIFGNPVMDLPATQIYTGSYTGTGTYGSSNPNTLTFPFEPKVIIFLNRWDGNSNMQLSQPVTFSSDLLSTTYSKIKVSWVPGTDNTFCAALHGTTFYFYSGDSSFFQMNISGKKYYYLVIV